MTPVRKMIKLVEDPLDLSLLVEDSIDVNSKPKLKPYPTKDNWYVIGKRT